MFPTKKQDIALCVMALLDTKKPKRVQTLLQELTPKGIDTTEHFLQQILLDLKRAGITKVQRGPGGGILLNKSVVDCLEVLEATGRFREPEGHETKLIIYSIKKFLKLYKLKRGDDVLGGAE